MTKFSQSFVSYYKLFITFRSDRNKKSTPAWFLVNKMTLALLLKPHTNISLKISFCDKCN